MRRPVLFYRGGCARCRVLARLARAVSLGLVCTVALGSQPPAPGRPPVLAPRRLTLVVGGFSCQGAAAAMLLGAPLGLVVAAVLWIWT